MGSIQLQERCRNVYLQVGIPASGSLFSLDWNGGIAESAKSQIISYMLYHNI